jgi:hypothetical protein
MMTFVTIVVSGWRPVVVGRLLVSVVAWRMIVIRLPVIRPRVIRRIAVTHSGGNSHNSASSSHDSTSALFFLQTVVVRLMRWRHIISVTISRVIEIAWRLAASTRRRNPRRLLVVIALVHVFSILIPLGWSSLRQVEIIS